MYVCGCGLSEDMLPKVVQESSRIIRQMLCSFETSEFIKLDKHKLFCSGEIACPVRERMNLLIDCFLERLMGRCIGRWINPSSILDAVIGFCFMIRYGLMLLRRDIIWVILMLFWLLNITFSMTWFAAETGNIESSLKCLQDLVVEGREEEFQAGF